MNYEKEKDTSTTTTKTHMRETSHKERHTEKECTNGPTVKYTTENGNADSSMVMESGKEYMGILI